METPEDPATMLPLAFHYLVPEYVGFMKVKHLYASKNYLTTATNDEQHRLLQLPQKAINFVLFVAKSTARTDPFAIFISHREAETFMEEIHFQSTSSYFVMEIYSYQVIARNMIAEDIIKAMQSTAVSVLHFYSLLYSGSYLYIFQNPFFLKLWMSWLYQKNDSTVPAEVEFQRKYKMYRHSLYKKRESDYSLFLEIYGPSLLMPYNPTRELKTADWDKNYAIGMPKDVDPLAHSGPISLMERSDAIKGNLEDRGLWSLSTGVVFDFSPFLEPTLVQAPIFFPMEEEPRDDEDSDDENDGPDSPNNPGKNVVGTTIIFGMFAGVLILNWFFLDVEEDEESLATKKAEEKKQEAAREQAMKEELVKLTDSSLHEAGCAYWPLSFLFIISLLII